MEIPYTRTYFDKVDQKIWRTREEINLHLRVSYDHRRADFNETYACSVTFEKIILTTNFIETRQTV